MAASIGQEASNVCIIKRSVGEIKVVAPSRTLDVVDCGQGAPFTSPTHANLKVPEDHCQLQRQVSWGASTAARSDDSSIHSILSNWQAYREATLSRKAEAPSQREREIVSAMDDWFDLRSMLGNRKPQEEAVDGAGLSRESSLEELRETTTSVDDWFDLGKLFGCLEAREGH